ncbi:MAG: TonB-dependent receptor [bacterium]|nr:TonB-dependent receptor [bacterium]
MLKHKFLILMVAAIFAFSGFAYGQEQSGEIIGTVILEDGSAIPGVSIEIDGAKLIGKKVSVSNESGSYRLMSLPSGTYTVTFSLEGFKTVKRKGVRVDLGKTFKLDVMMETGAIREEVIVSGQLPVVDVRKSSSSVNINKDTFAKLPKASRNFLSVATQQAGINYEREFDDQDEGDFDNERETAISFDGASASENTFFVDGMNTTTMEGGISGNNVNTDFIEEVQVKSSGYAAEYGGSMGGVISVITRSGGNEFHGDLSMYYDSDWLRAAPRDILQLNPTDSTVAEYSDFLVDKWNRYEPGVSIGGYLIRDKVWFFASFMPQWRTRTREAVFISDPSKSGTEFDFQDNRYNGSAKFTAALGSNIRLSVSGNLNWRERENQLPNQDGSSSASATNLKNMSDWAFRDPGANAAAHLDYNLGNTGLLSVSGGFFRTNGYQSGDLDAPITRLRMRYSNFDVPGMPEDLKRPANWNNVSFASLQESTKDISRKIMGKSDLSLYLNAGGEHVFKGGFGWNQVYHDKLTSAINTPYWYFYWKQSNGTASVYTTGGGTAYQTTYGYARELGPYGTIADLTSDRYSVYLQDSWTIGDKLTVNYGVRLEKEDMPSMDDNHPEAAFSFGFFDKIAPRVGFAYDLKGNGNTKVFGSFGIYYDVMKLDMTVGSFGGLRWYDSWYDIGTLDWTQYANQRGWSFTGSTEPILGGQFYEAINHRVPSFDLVQPDIKPGSKMEISLGFQQKINDNVSFTARFLHHRLLNVIEDIGVEIAGNETYYIANPGSDWINEQYGLSAEQGYLPAGRVVPDPTREYYSVQVGLDKKFSNNWLGGVTLTWSSLKGIISGLASSDEHGRQNPMVQRYFDLWFLHYDSHGQLLNGTLPTDRPLDLKLYGAYTFDFGMTLGFSGFVKSGTPVSTEFLLNSQQGWYPNGRGDLGRTDMLWQLDLYAEYNIRLGSRFNLNLNANVTNITNNNIAQRVYNRLYDLAFDMSNDEIVAGFDVNSVLAANGLSVDPRFGMGQFFMPEIAVRLGAKLSF